MQEFSNEWLWAAVTGRLFVNIAWAAAFIGVIAGIFLKQSGKRLTNIAFIVQSVSMFSVIALMYVLIFNHQFEFDYVRKHSDETMPLKYMISCFWGGQQGSFILWIFWHAVLGLFIMWRKYKNNQLHIGILSAIQLVLISMLLGVSLPSAFILIITGILFTLPAALIFQSRSVSPLLAIHPLKSVQQSILIIRDNKTAGMLSLISSLMPIIMVGVVLIQAISGIDVLELKGLGISPFELTRERFADNITFMMGDYTAMIEGKGLNPLLQNYWMVIHPPILFLGFATVSIPFMFLTAALVKQEFTSWTSIALPWGLFSGGILGAGIIMGGIWAYESLSFGGFWAWDPVENASLVPWLTLVAAIHTHIIYNHSKQALKSTYVLYIISFFLILYSTFLTRSGILGDSSVHSFTDLGMMGQLIVLIFALLLPGLFLLFSYWKKIPTPKKEEHFSSRELWMFIGSLVLLLSAIHVTFNTSIPVWNSIRASFADLFGMDEPRKLAPPSNVVEFYNSVQIWFGIIIGLLTAFVQFLKWKKTSLQSVLQTIIIDLSIAVGLTIIIHYSIQIESTSEVFLFLFGSYAVVGNLHFLLFKIRKKGPAIGASLAHIGFGLLLVGMVIALGKSTVISKNLKGINYGEGFDENFKRDNIMLNKENSEVMGNYIVSYQGRIKEGPNLYYEVKYEQVANESEEVITEFSLFPHLLDHPEMGLTPNPATKHYWDKDVFTHVTSIPEGSEKRPVGTKTATELSLLPNDTVFTGKTLVVFEKFIPFESKNSDDFMVETQLKLITLDTTYTVRPTYAIVDGKTEFEQVEIADANIAIELSSIDPAEGKFKFKLYEEKDWIIMKAIIFPYINVLWAGIIICIIGFGLSVYFRAMEVNRGKNRD